MLWSLLLESLGRVNVIGSSLGFGSLESTAPLGEPMLFSILDCQNEPTFHHQCRFRKLFLVFPWFRFLNRIYRYLRTIAWLSCNTSISDYWIEINLHPERIQFSVFNNFEDLPFFSFSAIKSPLPNCFNHRSSTIDHVVSSHKKTDVFRSTCLKKTLK